MSTRPKDYLNGLKEKNDKNADAFEKMLQQHVPGFKDAYLDHTKHSEEEVSITPLTQAKCPIEIEPTPEDMTSRTSSPTLMGETLPELAPREGNQSGAPMESFSQISDPTSTDFFLEFLATQGNLNVGNFDDELPEGAEFCPTSGNTVLEAQSSNHEEESEILCHRLGSPHHLEDDQDIDSFFNF